MRISVAIQQGARALAINSSMALDVSGKPNHCTICSSLSTKLEKVVVGDTVKAYITDQGHTTTF